LLNHHQQLISSVIFIGFSNILQPFWLHNSNQKLNRFRLKSNYKLS
jgi:hypothetical protein